MSSFEPRPGRSPDLLGRSGGGRSRPGHRVGRAILSVLVPTIALAACTVQPLYAPTAAGLSVNTTLGQVAIDPVDTRVAQELRNRLIFVLYGGGASDAPLYRMRLTVTSTENALGVTPVESAAAYSVAVTATYQVNSVATGEIVLRATERGTATYDRVNQIFANTRARLDAENRAAVVVADAIHVRLAAAVAKGTL